MIRQTMFGLKLERTEEPVTAHGGLALLKAKQRLRIRNITGTPGFIVGTEHVPGALDLTGIGGVPPQVDEPPAAVPPGDPRQWSPLSSRRGHDH